MENKNAISSRISDEQKKKIIFASKLVGLSVCAFVRSHAISGANKIIRENQENAN